MIDTSGIDIQSVIDQLCCIKWQGKTVKVRGLLELHGGPCPFCHIGKDRFCIWPYGSSEDPTPRFYCGIHGNGCKAHGDVIRFIQLLKNCTFREAVDLLQEMGFPVGDSAGNTPRPYAPARELPPSEKWQQTGNAFVHVARQCLASQKGARVLDFLHTQRGLIDESIEHFRIGYAPTWTEHKYETWGIEGEGTFWIPPGIVIPTYQGTILWKINIRVSPRERARAKRKGVDLPKYMQVKGSQNSPFNVDAIISGYPIFMTESELDAILGQQESGYSFVATGGTNGALTARWIARLSLASYIILAFDNDNGIGLKAAEEWIKIFGDKSMLWLPTAIKDINDMWLQKQDIKVWASVPLRLLSSDTSAKPNNVEQDDTIPFVCILCPSEVEYYTAEGTPYCKYHYEAFISRCHTLQESEWYGCKEDMARIPDSVWHAIPRGKIWQSIIDGKYP